MSADWRFLYVLPNPEVVVTACSDDDTFQCLPEAPTRLSGLRKRVARGPGRPGNRSRPWMVPGDLAMKFLRPTR